MVQAYETYDLNPGLYNYLSYSMQDFFNYKMQATKLNFATSLGYKTADRAKYIKKTPQPPPETWTALFYLF